jgi:hypothetical protein
MNFIIGTIIEPKLVGRGVGLSTLVVFLSLILWGNLLGLIGMVLCIPFTMTLRFVLENNKDTRWIAVLLGPESPPMTNRSQYGRQCMRKTQSFVVSQRHSFLYILAISLKNLMTHCETIIK